MTDSFPIDIIFTDLLSWLTDRYLIPKDWPKRLEAISLKKIELLEQIQNKQDKDFQKIKDSFALGSELSYEHCKRLQTMIIKTEEAKAKTLFGNYSSPIIKNLLLIISLYEKNNVFLCEYAKLISQYIKYDIDSCEKNIAYLDKNISESSTKESDKEGLIKKNTEAIRVVCKKYCLNENISKKIYDLVDKISHQSNFDSSSKNNFNNEINSLYKEVGINLTSRLADLEIKLKDISQAFKSEELALCIDFYSQFYKACRTICNNSDFKNEENINNVNSNVNNNNKKGKKKGNTNNTLISNTNDTNSTSNNNSLEEIYSNFLIELKIINKSGDIQIEKGKLNELNNNNNSNNNRNIYSIIKDKETEYLKIFDNVENVKSFFLQFSNYKITEATEETKVYTTLLLDSDSRIRLINNLNEIKNFIVQRQSQAESNLEINFLLYADEIRELLSKYSSSKLDSFLLEINKCLDLLDDSDFKFLLRLFESQNALANIISQLDICYETVVKNKEELLSLKSKVISSQEQIKINQKQMEDLKKELRGMKKLVDKTLTTLLKRKISVMGSKNLF